MGNVHSSLCPILPQLFYICLFKFSSGSTDTAKSRSLCYKAKATLGETWLGNRAAILLHLFCVTQFSGSLVLSKKSGLAFGSLFVRRDTTP